MNITFVNPAGNITAIVEGDIPESERLEISNKILNDKQAEQVGFVVPPVNGGDCRLEMMGGEFCGNASRSIAYLYAKRKYGTGDHQISVEMSGVKHPVEVYVYLDTNEAYTDMPLPYYQKSLVEGTLIECPGIDHILVNVGALPDNYDIRTEGEAMIRRIIERAPKDIEAIGLIFVDGDELTPLVYVRSTDSYVWESSCGSGSIAAAWYLYNATGKMTYVFNQPGGTINVLITKDAEGLHMGMGGKLNIID